MNSNGYSKSITDIIPVTEWQLLLKYSHGLDLIADSGFSYSKKIIWSLDCNCHILRDIISWKIILSIATWNPRLQSHVWARSVIDMFGLWFVTSRGHIFLQLQTKKRVFIVWCIIDCPESGLSYEDRYLII